MIIFCHYSENFLSSLRKFNLDISVPLYQKLQHIVSSPFYIFSEDMVGCFNKLCTFVLLKSKHSINK